MTNFLSLSMASCRLPFCLKKQNRTQHSMAGLCFSLRKTVGGMPITPTFLVSHLVNRKSFNSSNSDDKSVFASTKISEKAILEAKNKCKGNFRSKK